MKKQLCQQFHYYVLADYNLDQFALMYEMSASNLEIKLFLGETVNIPFFENSTSPITDPTWNFHSTDIPHIKITLPNYQIGQFGLQLNNLGEIGAVRVDDVPTANGPRVNQHNNSIAYISNNGNLNETLGQQVAKSPVSDDLSGQPIEIIIKTGGDEYECDETDEHIDGQRE